MYSPYHMSSQRVNQKAAEQSAIKLNQLPHNVLRRIASHLPARKMPPVALDEEYNDAYSAANLRNGTHHRFKVGSDARYPPYARNIVERVLGLGSGKTVPASQVAHYLKHVVPSELAQNGALRGYSVINFYINNEPDYEPVILNSEDPNGVATRPAVRWTKAHEIHMKRRGCTNLRCVSRSTRNALTRSDNNVPSTPLPSRSTSPATNTPNKPPAKRKTRHNKNKSKRLSVR